MSNFISQDDGYLRHQELLRQAEEKRLAKRYATKQNANVQLMARIITGIRNSARAATIFSHEPSLVSAKEIPDGC